MNEAVKSMETEIEQALNSRILHFKDNADSLTLERVRRLLEKDMGLARFKLDAHKRFIKRLIEKHLEGPDNEDASENAIENGEKNVSSPKTEAAESPLKNEIKKDRKEPIDEDVMKTEDSPIMGLMTAKDGSMDSQSTEITESKIKKALWDRASHIRDNSETITPAGVRRLLEEDLGIPASSLDPFKKFIRIQIDEVFQSSEVNDSATGLKKEENSLENQVDRAEKDMPEAGSGSLDSENEVDENPKSRKKVVAREKVDKSVGMKKRKAPEKEADVSSKKQKKFAREPSDADTDEGDGDSGSGDLHSSEKSSKTKQSPTLGYGKRVENLKSVIKACGMSVAPSVYKKAKQVPDEKREGFLIKELEQILSREGLSTNPSEKEIKEVRKRKEREKELEGIDLSNIVSSSRRRTTTTYMAAPKTKVHAECSVDGTSSIKKNENDEDDDDNDVSKAPEGKEEKKEEEKEEERGKEEEAQEDDDEEEEDDDDEEDEDGDEDDDDSDEFNEDDEDSG